MKIVHKVLVWKREEKIPLDVPRRDGRITLKCILRIRLAETRIRWQVVMNRAVNLLVP